jgi:nucleoside 2-deoxyribosyltransferase
MKIFLSVSIGGNHDHKKYYPEIIAEIKKYGEVLTEFQDVNSKVYADGDLNTEEIYKRDTGLIQQSDLVVAEVSVPSLGVGYEIAYAEALKKPIICLYMSIPDIKLSAMVKGCPKVKVCEYHNMVEMREILKKELGKK